MNDTNSNLLNDLRNNREFVLTVLDQPIVFHKMYVRITGSVTAALMLSYAAQLADDIDHHGRGGWFSLDAENWEDETGLTRKEQATARKRLRELGLLDERKQGMPAHIEFKVNFQEIAARLHAYAEGMPKQTTVMTA